MNKEIEFFLVGSLVLSGCAPVIARAQSIESPTPKPKDYYPTLTLPGPTKIIVPTPTPTNIPYHIPDIAIMPTNTPLLPWIYFSQSVLTNEFTQDKTKNKSKISDVGCGLIVGAMVTRTNYATYYQDFINYFASIGKDGTQRITKNGSDILDHMAVLQSLGYDVEEISVPGSTMDEIKTKIAMETALGHPVWIQADFYGRGHQSMAIGVNKGIIVNDPLYGEAVEIPDAKIRVTDSKGNILWKVFVIRPPATP